MKGKIKFYNDMRNFGFITGDDGKEYFFHISGVEGGKILKEEDKVTFETEMGDRGLKAVKVKIAAEGEDEEPAEEEKEEDSDESEEENEEEEDDKEE